MTALWLLFRGSLRLIFLFIFLTGGPSLPGQSLDDHWPPSSITTDQLGAYPKAILRLQREGRLSAGTTHRTCKYLNNIIEADHGALKQVIRPTRGFQTMKTAAATIKGFQVMRMIRPGHCLTCKPSVKDEVRFGNKLFNIFSLAV
jgi:IS6 family transposase